MRLRKAVFACFAIVAVIGFTGCSQAPLGPSNNTPPPPPPPHSGIYVDPPLDFPNFPVKVVLETIFLKANAPYSIEVPDIASKGGVVLTVNSRIEIDTLLNIILDSKGMKYTRDKNGVFHIIPK